MSKNYDINNFSIYSCILLIFVCSIFLNAQNRELVWAEEFNENTIDLSNWDYDTGPSNDNVHYYTSRNENVQIADGVLNIIALEESYQGYNYTSGLIKTKKNWRYGRIEARIKLPATNGFVPAFWMLPADNIYGWWPKSGEIDIMEHPTNEVSNIYGSIHTETYNNFGGIGNEGDVTEITDAASEFHVYAIDWTEDKIDFYVDNNLYYTFNNAHSGSAEWPFDKPFYIILNLAVGGGWVGDPDETSVFPARMEVDWIKVYQYFDDIAIQGADFIPYNSSDITYFIPDLQDAETTWELPGNAEISVGQNTNQIKVDWNYFGGDIKVNVTTNNGSRTISYPVKVSENLLKNPGFEKGVKYWNQIVGYPASAAFSLNTADIFYGNQALSVDIQTLGTNPWDIQITQKELFLKSGQQYTLSFWAKSDNANGEINLALINSDFFVYRSERFELSNNWAQYKIDYTATTNDMVNMNIDLGIKTGVYYFDQFLLTTPEFSNANQIRNADFFESDSGWNFVTHGSVQANGTVINGEYRVSIVNGGNAAWDIHLGQSPLTIENGKKYTITFDAYATSPRTISALVGMNADPWTVYSGDKIISLTTKKQTYSYSFIMNYPSDNQSRFGFDLGGFAVDVFFDNLIVSSGTNTVGTPKISNAPQRIQLFQNYPNPFNPSTSIIYQLPKTSEVELSIYNLLGQKVATLVSEKQQSGQHQVQWDASSYASGIYYYMITAGEFRQVKKMVLVR